ncbi:hypothetical protein [Methylocapsa sp. S129]|uniref:hypothetical protein n=1 Tax=Methylocapsa sp. S129 TaxID=1641869 RepID=UPI00131C1798|nr:hypothetical protein [Methylocapsa sp. S129]
MLTLAASMTIGAAAAQDGKDCFSQDAHLNVCEKARALQAKIAQLLPIQMKTNVIFTKVGAVGTRVVITANWGLSKSEFDASSHASGMSARDLASQVESNMRGSVCSEPIMATFVRLGGQVQYLYQTKDGHIVLSPIVTGC